MNNLNHTKIEDMSIDQLRQGKKAAQKRSDVKVVELYEKAIDERLGIDGTIRDSNSY